MASVTEITQAVLDTIKDNLPDVDQVSLTSFLPVIKTAKIAVMGVSQGHQDEGYVYGPGYMHVVHRLRLLVWVKLVQGLETTYHQRARDFGYDAMRVLVAHNLDDGYQLYNAGEGIAMTYSVDPAVIVEGGQPYLVGTLIVPVTQKETV